MLHWVFLLQLLSRYSVLHGRDSLGLGSLSLCVHPHVVSFGSSSWVLVWEYFPDLLAYRGALYALGSDTPYMGCLSPPSAT